MNTDNADISYLARQYGDVSPHSRSGCQTYLRAPIVRKQTQKQANRHIKQRRFPTQAVCSSHPEGAKMKLVSVLGLL